jgi:hypothetical protein
MKSRNFIEENQQIIREETVVYLPSVKNKLTHVALVFYYIYYYVDLVICREK